MWSRLHFKMDGVLGVIGAFGIVENIVHDG